MTTASARFAGIPEMLGLMMDHVTSRKQLANLRYVSRAFDAAATPIFFRDVDYEPGADKFAFLKDSSSRLGLIRSLVVQGQFDWRTCNETILQILPEMPRLEAVEFNQFPVTAATLDTLHQSCKQVKSISIRFPCDMDESVLGLGGLPGQQDTDPDQEEAQQLCTKLSGLTSFSGLEELTLEELHDDLSWWRNTILKMLCNSPWLRKLKLSISEYTISRYYFDHDPTTYLGFFENLCREYAETGASPLRLESLHCGTSIYPSDQVSLLEKLTDLSRLETVHISNRNVTAISMEVIELYGSGEDAGIGIHAFGPNHCPNLRRFTASDYRGDVHELFAQVTNASWCHQVAISCERQGQGYEMAGLLRPSTDYPSLPLHFRMLDIDLQRGDVYTHEYGEDEDSEDEGNEVSAAEVLDHLVAGDNNCLEGLAVRLPWVNEGDHDGKCEFEYLDLVEQALPRLRSLTQLAVVLDGLGRRTAHTEDMSTSAAERLAAASPTLHYIKIIWRFWQVWRGHDGTVRLDELDEDEARHVELFNRSVWTPDW